VLFVKMPHNLQLCTISPNKANRVGLHGARTGDAVLMLVDSGSVLLDVTKAGRAFADHRMIVGTLHYADPYQPTLFMSASAAIADSLLRRASAGRLAARFLTYCSSTPRGLAAPHACLAMRLRDFATNHHE